MQNENAFHDIAITASQLWGQLDEDAKKGFRERHQAMVRLRSKNQKLQALGVDAYRLIESCVFQFWAFYRCLCRTLCACDGTTHLLVLNDHYMGCVVARK